MPDIPVFVLFGATASGKTALAEALWASPSAPDSSASAESCHHEEPSSLSASLFSGTAFSGVELVSADSMQVYRGMDIGTAKPDADLQRRLFHHLVDIRNPDEPFCAGDFVREADACCASIFARGKVPVLCGGTGFYIRNFLYGLPCTPQSNPETRKRLAGRMRREGAAVLLAELRRVDPARAEQLNVRDEYRILRALEIYYDSGIAQSAFALPERTREGYRFCTVSLDRPREELYRRIEARCAEMFARGLAEEVAALAAAGCRADSPGMRAIGYREFFQAEGCAEKLAAGVPLSEAELAGIRDAVVRDSKRYAKRQETYIKPLPGVIHLTAGENTERELRRLFAAFVRGGETDGADGGKGEGG